MATALRIHPALGISRVGNSDEYILSPETSAGMPEPGTDIAGGLPLVPGTDSTTITDADLRDTTGKLKPHAQRFRIFAYLDAPDGTYPYKGEVAEVIVGSTVDGKVVESITWQVHMANKKANNWIIPENPKTELAMDPQANFGVGGLAWYFDGGTPNVRNGNFGKNAEVKAGGGKGLAADQVDMSDPTRLKHLVLDSGPKVLTSGTGSRVRFDAETPCQYINDKGQITDVDYPVQFPHLNFKTLYEPAGSLRNMGSMETDSEGRLHVIGAPGFAAGWMQSENNPGGSVPSGTADDPFPLGSDIDNNGWFDDAGDGPVSAMLTFADGTTRVLENTAWCLCADPSYAPQVRNVVTIWDEVYNAWLRAPELKLDTSIYTPTSRVDGTYSDTYMPAFEQDVWTIFRAAHLQMFTTDLNTKGIGAHRRINGISASDDPASYLNIKSFIRDPNTAPGNELKDGSPKMPLALGDTGASFLTVTNTQYFFLNQWFAGTYDDRSEDLTAGELLDKNTLTNLLGGRFSPGIDLTFIVRDPYLYNQDWTSPEVGPFRVGAKSLTYGDAKPDTPFLNVGYKPGFNNPPGNGTTEPADLLQVEPGDLCKFMALPWHTDYNSCATHEPAPNPAHNTTLFWSWPAQRPVSVFTFDDYVNQGNNLFPAVQQFSVRGTGTVVKANSLNEGPAATENAGRFQNRLDIIRKWFEIGVVIQGPAIGAFEGENTDIFLEVESRLTGPSDWSQEWPILTTDRIYPSRDS